MKVCTCGVWASLGVDERRWLQERMQKSRAVCFKSGHMVGGRHCMLAVGILRSGREIWTVNSILRTEMGLVKVEM